MESQGMMYLQTLIGLFGSAMVIAALFMLWSKHRSNWLLLALAGEGASLVFRGLVSLLPSLIGGGSQMIYLLWQAAGLMLAAGLLGYALEQTQRKPG